MSLRAAMGVGDRREAKEGGDIHKLTADSHCCTADTNTALKALILQLKIDKSGHRFRCSGRAT